ncbi:hypothetical protein [Streptomyces sp. R08]|uniref:Uncharacterized protein n=1 Tax=Streptomyces sp. R08 TaxID=3238624 RepID=A0AB39M9M1_9ACTN
MGYDEGDEPAVSGGGIVEVDDEAVVDLGEGFEDVVELGGAQPYPAVVEGGVGAAADHGRAPAGEGDPVALPPDTGIRGR